MYVSVYMYKGELATEHLSRQKRGNRSNSQDVSNHGCYACRSLCCCCLLLFEGRNSVLRPLSAAFDFKIATNKDRAEQ